MIWAFEEVLSRRLQLWALLSMLGGVCLLYSNDLFWRGFGMQAILWGAIEAAIAVRAHLRAQRQSALPSTLAERAQEAQRLRRLLWLNTGLDVLYVAGGLALAFTLGASDPAWRGHGWGIVAQGGFLFLFDLFHARSVPTQLPLLPLKIFEGPEHQPFLWEGGQPAALLVHGFPGTPAELRPLAAVLQQDGWTVQGLLLPGFGPQIATLGERRWQEWLAAITQALADLRRHHTPLLLIGYSMGAALAIGAAASQSVDGLILLAPFVWRESLLQRVAATFFGPLLTPYFRPFRQANFADPALRRGIASLLPQLDLDNPEVQAALRQAAIPLSLLQQVRLAGLHAARQAAAVPGPVLILQGQDDPVARPKNTQFLLTRFPTRPSYREVAAGHDIVNPATPGWAEVVQSVRQFAAALRPQAKDTNDKEKLLC